MDKLSYSLGILVAQNLKKQGIDKVNATDVANGIADVIGNKPTQITLQEADQVLQEHMREQAQKQMVVNQKFLEENRKREGVITLQSGLQYEVLKEGNGPKPALTDKVTTHYHGTLIDGQVFDSSVQRNQPASFPVNGVIPGWVEALQLMSIGSKWRLFVPPHLAYGERGAGNMIGPNTPLIFEVELLKIN